MTPKRAEPVTEAAWDDYIKAAQDTRFPHCLWLATYMPVPRTRAQKRRAERKEKGEKP